MVAKFYALARVEKIDIAATRAQRQRRGVDVAEEMCITTGSDEGRPKLLGWLRKNEWGIIESTVRDVAPEGPVRERPAGML